MWVVVATVHDIEKGRLGPGQTADLGLITGAGVVIVSLTNQGPDFPLEEQ